MSDLILSNDNLDDLRSATKRVRNPNARWVAKPGNHEQKNYTAESEDGKEFQIYMRRNLNDNKDFSCGIALKQKGRKSLSIVRYNGSSHRHGDIQFKCHIHFATAEALETGKKIDSYAVSTDKYWTVEGALACLIDDCGVQGLSAQFDEPDLLDGN